MLKQAVLVNDGKIVKSIPPHPPKTIFRRCGPVGEYEGDKLVIVKHASFELWNREGTECFKSFHHPLIYCPHDVVQYGKDLLICSSGLELFLLMDIDGNVKWEWWGYKNGLGEKNAFFFRDDWVVCQTTTDISTSSTEQRAHFNSIYLMGDKFLAGALYQQKVVEITIGQDGFKLITDTEDKGLHSPFYHDGMLIYGTEDGIRAGPNKVLTDYKWVKTIRAFEDGFIFTHDKGLITTDANWQIKEDISLPMPYKFVYLERNKDEPKEI